MKKSLAVMLCGMVMFLACGGNPNMDAGLEQLEKGEYEFAMLRFTNVAKEEPDNLEAQYYAALTVLLNEDFKGALEYGKKMTALLESRKKGKKLGYGLTADMVRAFDLVLHVQNGDWKPAKEKRDELVAPLENFVATGHEFVRSGAAGILGQWRFKWKFDTMGRVMSSPLVQDGKLYIASDGGNVFCLHADDGTPLWTCETPHPFFNNSPFTADNRLYAVNRDTLLEIDIEKGSVIRRYPDISTQCLVRDKKIYAVYSPSILKPDEDPFYVIKCLSRSSGRTLWQRRYENEFSFFCPLMVDGVLFVQASDNFFALDAKTGKVRWTVKIYSRSYPRFARVLDNTLLFASDKACYRISIKDGTEVWKFTAGGEIESTPTVGDGFIYFGCNDSHLYAVSTDGSLKWKKKTYGRIVSTPLVNGAVVYAGSEDDNLYCFEAATGVLKWRYKMDGGCVSSPAVAGNLVYVGCNDDYVYAFATEMK